MTDSGVIDEHRWFPKGIAYLLRDVPNTALGRDVAVKVVDVRVLVKLGRRRLYVKNRNLDAPC